VFRTKANRVCTATDISDVTTMSQ